MRLSYHLDAYRGLAPASVVVGHACRAPAPLGLRVLEEHHSLTKGSWGAFCSADGAGAVSARQAGCTKPVGSSGRSWRR